MARPWIKWDGGEMPVQKGTMVDVTHRCGDKCLNQKAGFGKAEDWSIDSDDECHGDIVAWRLAAD